MKICCCSLFAFLLLASPGVAQSLFVEAESFDEPGGWKLDTQFIDTMGSPYLLAHLGRPRRRARLLAEADFATSHRTAPHRTHGALLATRETARPCTTGRDTAEIDTSVQTAASMV